MSLAVATSTPETNQVNWVTVGYETAPFSNTANQSQLFFKSQALINTLNKLCTLDSSDTCITALIGERGSGKTTCLRALNKIRTHYHSMIIEASNGLSPQNLIKAVFKGKLAHTPTSRLPTTEECVQLLKQLNHSGKQIRVLIDKAQDLPKATLSLVRKLCSIQSNGSQVQFVLCTHQPKDIAEIYHDDQIKSQAIQLHNLTRQETEKFINIKLQSTPSTHKPQQAPKECVDQIYEQTRGNLFKINEAAARVLPTVLKPQPTPKTQSRLNPATLKKLALSSATLLLIMAGLKLHHQHSLSSIATPKKTRAVQFTKQPPLAPPSPAKISRLLFTLTQP